MIYVTHDQEEALTLSDRVAVMNGGRIEQLDDPRTIYRAPRTRFVADFIGASSFVEGRVCGSRDDGVEVAIDGAGTIPVCTAAAITVGTRVQLAVRSDRMRLVPESDSPPGPTLAARVVDTAFAGSIEHVTLDLGSARYLTAHLPSGAALQLPPDARVRLYVAPKDWMVLA
ncbi:MAG: TOBE domain-containing protein [Burkholderiaceae bacterium]|nr:TOBE domain-containing protein [Burkholderiaceae bacterium]